MSNKLKIVVKEPLKPAQVREVENELSAFQEIVGGLIEAVNFGDYSLTLNEEGKIEGLLPNLKLPGDVLVGTLYVVKIDNDGYEVSLNEQDIEKVMKMLDYYAIKSYAEADYYKEIIQSMF